MIEYNEDVIKLIKKKIKRRRSSRNDTKVLVEMIDWFVDKLNECEQYQIFEDWKKHFGVQND